MTPEQLESLTNEELQALSDALYDERVRRYSGDKASRTLVDVLAVNLGIEVSK